MYCQDRTSFFFVAISFFSVVFLMGGCSPKVYPTYQRDSIVTKVVYEMRDTIINVVLPTEEKVNVVEASDTSYLETTIAESWAVWNEGELHHWLKNKSNKPYIYPISLPFKEVSTTSNKVLTNTIYVEKELKQWQKGLMNIGAVAIVVLIVLIGVRMKRFML